MDVNHEDILDLLRFPEHARIAIDKANAEEKLLDYIRLLWPVLEPGRTFVEGWAVEAICDHLEAVSNGEIRKLLINVPPGCMKSLTTNVFWPSWEWGPRNRPDLRYVSASYSEALTVRDNRRCRQLIQSAEYQMLWGSHFKLMSDQNAKIRYDNDARGYKIATSVGGLGTGERGDRFVIDDPHNVIDGESDVKRDTVLQWFTEVVPTRINDAGKSAIVVIMQRVHEADVSGLILASELGYEHLMLPMEYEEKRSCVTCIGFEDPRREENELLWPDRFPRDYLDNDLKPALRAWGGTYAEAGQLQQRPAPRGGGMFQKKDFQFLDIIPQDVHQWVRGWDFAGSTEKRSPYSVGCLMGRRRNGDIVIRDVDRGQWTPGQLEAALVRNAEADDKGTIIDCPQDPGQAGKAQKVAYVKLLNGYDIRFSPESGSKEDRARPFAAQCEGQNIYLVRATWNDAYINELASFPTGMFKDQVDASSRAYAKLLGQSTGKIFVAPRIIAVD